MKTFLIIFLFICSNVYSQYTITPAFPNLADDFFSPTALVNSGDHTNRLFVSEITGKIYTFKNIPSVSSKKVFIDLGPILIGPRAYLLGLVFHPNYEVNRYFYVFYTYDSTGTSTLKLRLARFQTSTNNPDSAVLSSRINFLSFTQPQDTHEGGTLEFGSDGYLYISVGDGGQNGVLAQNNTNLSGKMLRINVDVGNPYSIPSDNPYFNHATFRKEIFASGFRNPWKMSFDILTGDLWCGDVGEVSYEEIDIVENGKNYGWNKMEGFHCYGTCDTTGMGFTRPVYEYFHTGGSASITGGYVYRGHLRPELYGKYIYADFMFGKLFSYDNGVNTLLNTSFTSMTTFGIGEDNELYVCDYSSGIYKFYEHFIFCDIDLDGIVDLSDMILVYNDATACLTGNVITDVNYDFIVDVGDILLVFNNL